jgi:hypothetical protein
MTDGFGYVWTINGTSTGGGIFNLSGTVANVGAVEWIVSGVGNANAKSISITATNPFPDFCYTQSDNFTYEGIVIGKTMSGNWSNNCGKHWHMVWVLIREETAQPFKVASGLLINGPASPRGQSSGLIELRERSDLSGSDFFNEELSIQSFPNPVSNQATILYTLFDNNQVNLVVYNSIGEEVIVLLNAQQASGSYSIDWNVRNSMGLRVTGGIYFVCLQTKGDTRSTFIIVE